MEMLAGASHGCWFPVRIPSSPIPKLLELFSPNGEFGARNQFREVGPRRRHPAAS
jgi:hypothetical protein